MISRIASPEFPVQTAIVVVVQEHLSEIFSCVVAFLLCAAVIAAAVFMLMLRPSPRHRLILDLWAWVGHEPQPSQSVSHFAARRAS